MLLANAPVIFCGQAFARRLPLKAQRYVASVLFLGLGIYFLARTFGE
jgi:putative Ca2+/H+ antiporter (TMEM165/GDT1 family)